MPKADSEYLWNELQPGCVITEPGTSRAYYTGDWRAFYPVLQKERCIQCGICWIFCPDMAYQKDEKGYYIADQLLRVGSAPNNGRCYAWKRKI